jgi:predicted DNA-binding transcriptional regulator YafY
MPTNKEHDTLAIRLSQILIMFNNGKRLSVEELAVEFAVEFAVNKRTIQRDLNRLSYLPIEKNDGYYYMEEYCLGKLSYKDIHQFATFSGIQELYPELSDELIVDILNVKTNKTIEVNGYKYEELSHKVDDFNNLGGAIVKNNSIDCYVT